MPWLAPVIGGALSVGSAAIGAGSAKGDREAQMAAYQQSVDDLTKIGIPSIEAQQLVLEHYKSAGQLSPELEEQIKQGNSAFEGISTDGAYKESQLDALNSLRGIGDSGGMNLTDKANLEKVMGDVNASEKGRRDAATSSLAARGQLGSGLELAARLGGGQQDAQNAHLAGVTAAANAEQRALDAIRSGGELGTNLRSQEFGEKSKVADASDAVARYNAGTGQEVQARNAAAKNDASKYNLGNNQTISNSNVDTSNKEQTFNKGLNQTQFENQMDVAKSKATARAGQAQAYGQNAQSTADLWSGVGSGLAKTGVAVGDYLTRDKNKQQPVTY